MDKKQKTSLSFLFLSTFFFVTWILPQTRALWDIVDKEIFYFLNSSLEGGRIWQLFWVMANMHFFDIFMFLFITIFFALWVYEDKKRISFFLYGLFWGEIGILFLKQCVAPSLHVFHMERASPSLLLSKTILLSQTVPWLALKDYAFSCFPSDHGEIILQWFLFVCVFCSKRYRLLALLSSLFFLLPRLVCGAHWFSDIFVGSFFVASLVTSVAFIPKVYEEIMGLLFVLIKKMIGKKEHAYESV